MILVTNVNSILQNLYKDFCGSLVLLISNTAINLRVTPTWCVCGDRDEKLEIKFCFFKYLIILYLVTTDTDAAADCARPTARSAAVKDPQNQNCMKIGACSLTLKMEAQNLLTSAHCVFLQNTEASCHPPLWSTRGLCMWRRTRAPCCCASLRAVQHRTTGKRPQVHLFVSVSDVLLIDTVQ